MQVRYITVHNICICMYIHTHKTTVCCCITLQVISCLWSPDYFNYNQVVWLYCCCPWLFAVSHYQSANAARADVFSLAPHEAGKLRLLLIQWESSAAFYDLITADVNFTMLTKWGRLQRGLVITALALGWHPWVSQIGNVYPAIRVYSIL